MFFIGIPILYISKAYRKNFKITFHSGGVFRIRQKVLCKYTNYLS